MYFNACCSSGALFGETVDLFSTWGIFQGNREDFEVIV